MPVELPVELWRVIVSCLPRADQRTCLHVCSALHDLALPHLFPRVDIFLGSWYGAQDPIQLSPLALDNLFVPPDSVLDSYRRRQISMEILARITSDPHFAGLVRVVNAGVFSQCSIGGIPIPENFVDALRCLTSLESFAYFGNYPPLKDQLLDALAAGSAKTLRHLRVPAEWNTDPARLHSTFSLESLEVGRIRDADLDPYPTAPDSNLAKSAETIRTLASLNASTLRRVRVLDLTWLDPLPHSLPALTSLELTYLHGRDVDTSVIPTHFPSLRSLVLVSVEHRHVAPLAAHPTALPLLDSFDVSSRYPVEVALLADFVRAKKHLRRLNVMTCDASLALLDLVAQLPRLEVLGLDLWTWEWAAAHHEVLDRSLPLGLTALLIWDGIAECTVSKDEWARLLEKRTALRYFHILAEMDRDADISAELLVHRPPALELLGFGSTLRSVVKSAPTKPPQDDNDDDEDARAVTSSLAKLQLNERERPAGGAAADSDAGPVYGYSKPWSLAKLWFRRPEDFGDPDWEWLLRGHNASLFNSAHVVS